MRTRLLPLLLLASFPAAGGAPEQDAWYVHRTVFFAVLEGLYEDGVATEDVEAILRMDPATRTYENFVTACPICGPARDAFLTYRVRPRWRGYKVLDDTFGKGLDETTRTASWSEDPATRFDALEGLVRTWVARRLARERLTDAERQAYARAFEDMRKEGMSRIDGGAPKKLKRCAMCDGAFGAAR